jgi:hypothetical protein
MVVGLSLPEAITSVPVSAIAAIAWLRPTSSSPSEAPAFICSARCLSQGIAASRLSAPMRSEAGRLCCLR